MEDKYAGWNRTFAVQDPALSILWKKKIGLCSYFPGLQKDPGRIKSELGFIFL